MKQQTLSLFDSQTVAINFFPATTTSPVILCFPAMGVRAEFYTPLAEPLVAKGITFVTADLRGLGSSSVRPSKQSDFGYKEMIEDVDSIVRAVKKEYPNQPLYLMGHSLGGQLASLYLGKNPKAAEGLILVAACSIYYKGWTGMERWKTLFGIQVFPLLSQLVGYFPGHKVGFGGKGAKTVMTDWGKVGKTGKYIVKNDSFDYEAGMQQTTTPILAASVEGDTLAPKLAIENLYKKFNSASRVELFELTRAATGTSLNHFNWVKNAAPLVERIKAWMPH